MITMFIRTRFPNLWRLYADERGFIATGTAIALAAAAASSAGGAIASHNSSSTSTTPTMDPAYGPLQSQILKMVQGRLTSGTDLTGYTNSGLAGINKSYGLADKSLQASLTARGLGSSPIAGAGEATLQTGRAGSASSFINSIPLLQRDLQTQDLSLGQQLLATGRGSASTGTTTDGGGAGGAATNLAAMLGYLQSTGAFKGSTARGPGGVLASNQTTPNYGMLPVGTGWG